MKLRVQTVLVGVLVLAIDAIEAQAQHTARARRVDSHEVHHGVEVKDPYRWLEAMRSPEVMKWARAEDTRARAFAARWAEHASVRRRIERAADHDVDLPAIHRGDRYFYTRLNSSGTSASIVVRRGVDGTEETIVDGSQEWKQGLVVDRIVWPSPDGTLVAYGLASPGSRWIEVRIRDVENGRDLADRLTGLRGGLFSNVSWAPDGKGLYYDGFTPAGGYSAASVGPVRRLSGGIPPTRRKAGGRSDPAGSSPGRHHPEPAAQR